jgi:hypothetical protein
MAKTKSFVFKIMSVNYNVYKILRIFAGGGPGFDFAQRIAFRESATATFPVSSFA